jgi:hypothetical protein
MPVRLPFFHDLPAHSYTVTLDGVQYGVRLVYRERTASWYLDLADQDGVWLLRGRRLSPGGSPQHGMVVDGPPGALIPVGADPYARHEIQLLYFSEAELEELEESADDALPVEIA